MASSPILRFRPADALVILCILLLAGASLVPFLRNAAVEPATVEVWQNGVLTRQIPAMSQVTFDVSGDYTNAITVDYGKVAVTHSDCPTQDCVHTGWISYTGQTIVCLPNGVEVRLTGGDAEPEIDGVSR
ncbi:MAG TPA: NusG domain II-containing protein [Candidatus Avoscillospira avistercoris]|uniref:NusG domain II-containing protein n=1 Tax=Candidatus Avoscillospira avistercoris TaxID=2840707 RepID=A0A9D1JUL2_9FIRM|nr:NusG domain II-containing protein [Candidatus Avoscillospira avistercoris]